MIGAMPDKGNKQIQISGAVAALAGDPNQSAIFSGTAGADVKAGSEGVNGRVDVKSKSMLSPLFNASRLTWSNGEEHVIDTPSRVLPTSMVLKGKASEGRSIEAILNDPGVSELQKQHPILKTEWLSNSITHADLKQKIFKLMNFCVEHYGEDMEPSSKALFSRV